MITPIRRITYDFKTGILEIDYDPTRYSAIFVEAFGELQLTCLDQNKEQFFYTIDVERGIFYEYRVQGAKDIHFIEFINTENYAAEFTDN